MILQYINGILMLHIKSKMTIALTHLTPTKTKVHVIKDVDFQHKLPKRDSLLCRFRFFFVFFFCFFLFFFFFFFFFLLARQIKSIFNKNRAFSETSMKFGM